MHFIVTLSLLVLSATWISGNVKKDHMAYWHDCLTVHKVQSDDVKASLEKELPSEQVGEAIKCQFRCFQEKSGYWNGDEFVKEKLIEALKSHEELASYYTKNKDEINKCMDIKKPNKCDNAYEIVKCLKRLHKDE